MVRSIELLFVLNVIVLNQAIAEKNISKVLFSRFSMKIIICVIFCRVW